MSSRDTCGARPISCRISGSSKAAPRPTFHRHGSYWLGKLRAIFSNAGLLQHLGGSIERKAVERPRPLMVRHLVEVGLAVVVQPAIDPERDTGDRADPLPHPLDTRPAHL